MAIGQRVLVVGTGPIGIAAANAVLDVIEEEQLCARANELGGRLKQRLEAIRSVTPEIVDIRGPGFMVAVEFADAKSHAPDAGFTTRVRLEAQKRGLILRKPHPRDGRAVGLHLTAAGQKMMASAERTAAELEQDVAARLTPGEGRTLIRLLKKIYL